MSESVFCDLGDLPDLKTQVSLIPLSSGNHVIRVVPPSRVGVDVFTGLDIPITHIVGSYSSCKHNHM